MVGLTTAVANPPFSRTLLLTKDKSNGISAKRAIKLNIGSMLPGQLMYPPSLSSIVTGAELGVPAVARLVLLAAILS